MKKKLTTIAIILLCLSVAVGGTWAYFTAEETAHNVITTGNIDIALGDGVVTTTITNVVPGQQATRNITVKNPGVNAAYVRVKLDKSIVLAQGKTGTVDTSLLELGHSGSKWTYQDGYYYYQDALQASAETQPLVVTVTFSKNMGNLYQSSTAQIDIISQATQVVNNGSTVFEAQGWPQPQTSQI